MSDDRIEAKYWVGSSGDYPERLYFEKEKAFQSSHSFIDGFNENGTHVKSYKLEKGSYTEDF